MMIQRVWTKSIGDNASIAITDHGKRRVTLPNSSASTPPRPLQRADNGPFFPADGSRFVSGAGGVLVKTIAHMSGLPELFVFYCSRCKQAETKVQERTAA